MHYSIKALLAGEVPVGQSVIVKGWVRTRRDSKAGFSFLNVSDGSCMTALQVVVANSLFNYEQEVLHLTAGCSVIVEGVLVASQGKNQAFEMQANEITVAGWVENPDTYPISPKHHSLEHLREVAHLRPRTNVIGAVMRVRHHLAFAIHEFFHKHGFMWVHTPLITSSDCEGAGELFRVSTLDLLNLPRSQSGNIDFSEDFFGKETFLTVSGQLNLEAYCSALSKVYTFGPTFRAENSNTTRHLAEFWMVEPEVAFADLDQIAALAEDLLKYVFEKILHDCAQDMAFFVDRIDKQCIARLQHIIESEFARIDYGEAIDLLKKANKSFSYPVEWGLDLQTEHERYLAEEVIGRPVIVMNYPKVIKSFYMRQNDDGKTVAAMDVLAPGIGEIIGGSQREERLEYLLARMDEGGLDKTTYSWYLDLRRYGTVPHSGFGLGLERLLCYITAMGNVRDVIPFPRTPKNAAY